MSDALTRLLKVNLRAREHGPVHRLLVDALGAATGHDRGSDTIGDFQARTFYLGGVMFDLVVPDSEDSALARVIDKHGEGVDSLCFATQDMNQTSACLAEQGIEFARRSEFHGNQVAFVRPRDACGIGLEFIEGPIARKGLDELDRMG